MTASSDERDAWMNAITMATIGSSGDTPDLFSPLPQDSSIGKHPPMSPYSVEINRFLNLQARAHTAQSREELMGAIGSLKEHALTIPVPFLLELYKFD
jgi:hypothetical protein